jgi:hypothetical protein
MDLGLRCCLVQFKNPHHFRTTSGGQLAHSLSARQHALQGSWPPLLLHCTLFSDRGAPSLGTRQRKGAHPRLIDRVIPCLREPEKPFEHFSRERWTVVSTRCAVRGPPGFQLADLDPASIHESQEGGRDVLIRGILAMIVGTAARIRENPPHFLGADHQVLLHPCQAVPQRIAHDTILPPGRTAFPTGCTPVAWTGGLPDVRTQSGCEPATDSAKQSRRFWHYRLHSALHPPSASGWANALCRRR